MNIAVVDDEEIIRQQIHGFIKKQEPDFNISDFATGEELLAAGREYDFIFLDIQMEGMGGIEVDEVFGSILSWDAFSLNCIG